MSTQKGSAETTSTAPTKDVVKAPVYIAQNATTIQLWLKNWEKSHDMKLSESQRKQHLGYMNRLSIMLAKDFKSVTIAEINTYLLKIKGDSKLGTAPRRGLHDSTIRMFSFLGILNNK